MTSLDIKNTSKKIIKSIWFFPFILLAVLILLSALELHGSSIGIYHDVFYGENSKDENLILNKPREVRSDEWLVTTQLTISQVENNFTAFNTNIGNGSDVSLIVDAPHDDLSQIFKPHNFSFFILPLDNAFSFKWWSLLFLLITSVYFFTLTVAPRRKKLAIILSLAFALSPFIQWWYQYITLAPIYYAIFGITVFIKILHSKSKKELILWSLALVYIAVNFIVILYPPFQLASALVALIFLIGYYLDNKQKVILSPKQIWITSAGILTIVTLLSLAIFAPKVDTINTFLNTDYPGDRSVSSGGIDPLEILSTNTLPLLQDDFRAGNNIDISTGEKINQSEYSNFHLVSLLLLPVILFLLLKHRKRTPNFYILTLLSSTFVGLLIWMTIPNIPLVGDLLLLSNVPHRRLFIALGLLNLLLITYAFMTLSHRNITISRPVLVAYTVGVACFYLAINLHISLIKPEYMGYKWAILLALPYPIFIYLALSKRFILASLTLLILSLSSSVLIHPLYKGLDIITDSKVSNTIDKVSDNDKRWATEGIWFENKPLANDKNSLSGVHTYPQLELWDPLDEDDKHKYNRYAHVHFDFSEDTDDISIKQPSGDQLILKINPCNQILNKWDVGYILTWRELDSSKNSCITSTNEIDYPNYDMFVYRLEF